MWTASQLHFLQKQTRTTCMPGTDGCPEHLSAVSDQCYKVFVELFTLVRAVKRACRGAVFCWRPARAEPSSVLLASSELPRSIPLRLLCSPHLCRSRRRVSSTPRNRSISLCMYVRLLAPTLAILHLLGLRAAPRSQGARWCVMPTTTTSALTIRATCLRLRAVALAILHLVGL